MANGHKDTHNEHFVPDGYLTGFSPNQNLKYPQIYQYDLSGIKIYDGNPVPIKSICFQYDLYETIMPNGNYFAINAHEHSIKAIEDTFYIHRNNIISRTHVANFNGNNFLSETEMSVLKIMIALQLIRYPERLQDAFNLMRKQKSMTSKSDHVVEIISKLMCLPMWINYDAIEITQEVKAFKEIADSPPVMIELIERLDGMNFRIGFSANGGIFTCDRPAMVTKTDADSFDYVIYPLSSTHVLYMCSDKLSLPNHNNNIFLMRKEDVIFVNKQICEFAKRWVYNSHPFTSNEIELINEVRRNDKA